MNDTTHGDSGRNSAPALTATGFYVRLPNNRVFECGDEPADVRAMAQAVKRFITESSTFVFTLEIEANA
jgi:hypothetical protein